MASDVTGLAEWLTEVFAGAEMRLEDDDGNEIVSSSVAVICEAAASCDEPLIDLVDGEGNAHGWTLPGDHEVVDPEPSYLTDGGMAFLFEPGVAISGEPTGKHMVPVVEIVEFADAPRYTLEDLQVSTPGSEVEIVLSNGRNRQEKQGQWKPIRSVFGQFSAILQQHTEGKKDGACFLQGECAGGARKAMAMIANYIIGVDLDSGKPLDEVMDAIIDAGLEAVIYTTHSHLKDTSEIKRDHFLKWSDGSDPTPDLVAEYLQMKKGMIPEVTRNITILDDSHHTEEGVVILVKHDPIPKFRVVFPLAEPFVFAKRGGPQKDAIAEWKERYAGFSTKMGFFFDETCADPARLFYLPRHKKGSVHGAWWIAGKPVSLDDYDRIKIKRDRRGRSTGPTNAFSEFAGDEEDDRDRYEIDGTNLVAWAAKNAKFFEAESFLTEVCPDAIREPRSGKPGVHVECPFEAEHSTFGGGGCFVVNASDNYNEGYDGGFTLTCVHDACSHRDRLDMLKGCIEEEWFTAEELEKTSHLVEVEIEDDEEEEVKPKAKPAEKPKQKKDEPVYEEGVDDSELDEETRNLRYFNKHYAVVSTTGGARILVEPKTKDDDIVFFTQSDIALIERNRFIYVAGKNGKTERIDGMKAWLEHPERRTYHRVLFDPSAQCGEGTYNLFTGFGYQPIKGDWSLLKSHVFENICESNEDLFDWLMTWMAHILQQPGRKPGSSVVVRGNKGTGKSTTFKYLGWIMGRHWHSTSNRKHIIGNFNAHIATALLMVCEEAFWAADPQGEGSLKDIITAETMMIEKKGYDAFRSKNYTRFVLVSNSSWVVPASLADERRFGVFQCSDARQGDTEFWGRVRVQMEEEGGIEAMMYDLANYVPKHGWEILFTPPETAALKDQQLESLSGLDKFMLELAKTGVYEPTDENKDAIELHEDRSTDIGGVELRAAVQDFLRYGFASDKAKTSLQEIADATKSWFNAGDFMLEVETMTNKKRIFRFPPLPEIRKHIEETKKVTLTKFATESVSVKKSRRG